MSNSPSSDPDKCVWFAHGLPQNPVNEDIEDFAQYRLRVYTTEPWSENIISLYFGEDFGTFSLDMLERYGKTQGGD